MTNSTEPGSVVLEMQGITKLFYGTTVLRNVHLTLKRGEVHALVGENGAGKSTLMNILFGMPVIAQTGGYQGEILVDGEPVPITTPRQAMDLGIGMVHQEFMLLPGFTILENIKLNREKTLPNVLSRFLGDNLATLDWPGMRQDARKALDLLEITVDEWAPVAGLPVGYLQFVEIAREIDRTSIKVLVLDEPTAVLTEQEAGVLLEAIRHIAARGIAVLFITHRLEEVMAAADRITILRDGEVAAVLPRQEARLEQVAQIMVGRRLEKTSLPPPVHTPGGPEMVLEIRNLEVGMPGENVRGLDLDVRRGEILGIGGLAGQGKLGIANGVMGLYPARGTVRKDGKPIPLNKPAAALAAGLAFVSEDRRGVGLLLDEPVGLNIAMTALQVQNRFLGPFQVMDQGSATTHAKRMISDLDIRCTGPDQPVRRLSGGNQQKVCLARAFTLGPDVLLVSEPTRGIDVGAKKLVLDLLVRFNREHGVTVIITSSELAELRGICDRIALVYRGKIAGILPPDAPDQDFGLLMSTAAGGGR